MKKGKGGFAAGIETIIIIAIACCMIFLNMFTTKKLTDLEMAGHEAVFIMDEIPFEYDQEFTEQIMQYLPEAYKMIEVYDPSMELLFQIEFGNEYVQKDDIKNYPDLLEILQSNKEGQTTLTIGDFEQNIYFKWVNNSRGDVRLLIVYSTIPTVKDLWVFSFVCYAVIVLVFVLLIIHHIKSYRDKVAQYKSISKDVNGVLKS